MPGILKPQVLALALAALVATAHGTMSDEKITIEVDHASGIVRLTAVSTGCTKPEHFTLSRSVEGEITAVRERPDRCRRKAFEISFEYALDEIPATDDENSSTQG